MVQGIVQPFRRDLSDFAVGAGANTLRSDIEQVLLTRCSVPGQPGEVPWRPEFGSALTLLRHANLDEATADLARVYVAEAIGRFVPRFRLHRVDIDLKPEANTLSIRVAGAPLDAPDRPLTVEVPAPLGSDEE